MRGAEDEKGTAVALAAFGLRVETGERRNRCEVWPENWATVKAFLALETQWRVVAGRAIGLDYAAIPATLGLLDIKKRDRKSVFNGLRIMERSVLDTWYPRETTI